MPRTAKTFEIEGERCEILDCADTAVLIPILLF